MKIVKVNNKEELSEKATELFVHALNRLEKPVIGLATGSTPEGMYDKLTEKYQAGDITFKNAITFNLDEYASLAADNPNSYRYYMDEKLFNHVDIQKENTHLPNGLAGDLQQECTTYDERIIEAGSLDFLVLGIGLNGHIGFNEPGTAFDSRTHVVELTESTREVNSRFFDSLDEVPTEALTMGLGTIMEAKEIMLLVQGVKKAEILKKVVHGEVAEEVPASILQRHPNTTIITDIEL
ncbi:glucosamine-6-phosphate deaminase [Pseudogracilibacillus auburnensis]|uniref:Glucosamine-6-phosphate deaminase n=1 Tax=Pseudogracilibacillus auburnensis TaxID=1494959 RepID=A0A2V3W7S5_9BACI|nr:glucosamine-6-phosphate deaminase [Pseudogracilibacillus auburnensis]PXW90387.1 glucosamine-6-phosphate deaminase [Pseudogracilibacillus auburnensis]